MMAKTCFVLLASACMLFMTVVPAQGEILSDTYTKAAAIRRQKASDSLNKMMSETLLAKEDPTIQCIGCRAGMTILKYLAKSSPSKTVIAETVKFVCEKFHIEDANVCSHIVTQYEDLLLQLLSTGYLDNEYICGVLDLCPRPVFPEWNVDIKGEKPPVNPYPAVEEGGDRLFFLHVTDVHIDPNYTEGLEAQCGEPICCRPPNNPGKEGNMAGPWGDYNCDAPKKLFENMLEFANTEEVRGKEGKYAYVILTGDLPPHDVWDVTRDQAIAAEDYVADTFTAKLPGVPVYAAVGNHESVPVNQFIPRDMKEGPKWDMQWLYDSLADKWEQWIGKEAADESRYGGYYSTLTEDGVRIISLNTNMGCNSENWWLRIPSNSTSDPDNMLHWLNKQLASAEENNEMCYIIQHISPDSGCGDEWWKNYFAITYRYENQILGNFAGHTHDDKWHVTYAKEGDHLRAMTTTYMAGSVTPYTKENPGFRVVEVDAKTKAIVDYKQYALNLTQANIDNKPNWFLSYTAKDGYGMKDLSPDSWHEASRHMATDRPELLTDYIKRTTKQLESGCEEDDGCRHGQLCSLYVSPPGVSSADICGQ